jgi:hypothetical protein
MGNGVSVLDFQAATVDDVPPVFFANGRALL